PARPRAFGRRTSDPEAVSPKRPPARLLDVGRVEMDLMHDLVRDIGYALRLLAKNPAFALASVLTLALGIGANVAVFSVVYGVLLRPLPYRDAGRLLLVSGEVDLAGASRPVPTSVQPGQFDAWQQSFAAIAPPAFYSISVQ